MAHQHLPEEVTQMAEQVAQNASSGVKQAVILWSLWGTSYSLQDAASVVSILAGLVGIVYTVHLLSKFYWDNVWSKLGKKKEPTNG